MNMVQNNGGMSISPVINPVQIVDDWAVVSDGSIAVVRGRDYHVDWLSADGTVTPSPKMPFDWQRMSDDDKIAAIDSAKAAAERTRAALASGAASVAADGATRVMMNFSTSGDGRLRTMNMSGGALTVEYVSPSELPDYRPAFNAGALKADLDGNLWIRTSTTRAGAIAGPIYDVVNRKGEVTDRIQVPSGRTIVGFGKGGVVYHWRATTRAPGSSARISSREKQIR